MSLVFTGDWLGGDTEHILDVLKSKGAVGSFFLTGRYLRNTAFKAGVERMFREGHFVGPHSDTHPKYCDKTCATQTLISRADFKRDLDRNLDELRKFGADPAKIRYYIPPSEMYTKEICRWSEADFGMEIVSFTSGTRTNADFTYGPGEVSSQKIWDSVWSHEAKEGLHGHILLMHVGVDPSRKDIFTRIYLGRLIEEVRNRGYQVVGLEELLSR